MKKISAIILSLLFVITGFSQSFAPIGAKWYYGHRENPFGSPAVGYMLFEATGDTSINSTVCRIIRKTYFASDSSVNDAGNIFVYADSNRIYYLDSTHFELLYDFNLNAGDTFFVKEPDSDIYQDSIIPFIIDSVDTETISGIPLKKMFFHDVNGHWDMFSPVIENIGSLFYFFPLTHIDCDVASCFNLRCYEDSSINFHLSSGNCDDIISSILSEENTDLGIITFPNPVKNKVYISIENHAVFLKQVDIYNGTGKLIKHYQFSNTNEFHKTVYSCHCLDHTKINVKDLFVGAYLMKIQTNKGTVIRKFVKQ